MAPYGQEDVPELRSVFEWPHLRQNAVFLDTQCMFLLSRAEYCAEYFSSIDRMPTVIGHFISRHVYNSKLGTKHPINTITCCRFVDVSNGKEIKKGLSWTVRFPGNSTDPPLVLTHGYSERRRSESHRPNGPALPPRRKRVQDHHSLRRPT